jgi:hypothetical protein
MAYHPREDASKYIEKLKKRQLFKGPTVCALAFSLRPKMIKNKGRHRNSW